eukprot:TRINITY_DN70015_c0_g1_i1.p2 TRINITY_DN70015_c0_g1~~TRINITY_DN70015_c0_g1_i1.p2  ORF type:complete len:116 (+),score=28.25 TRINITY_DN70015_c0_g1_i1:25-348(+)
MLEEVNKRRQDAWKEKEVAAFLDVPKDKWLAGIVAATAKFGVWIKVRHPTKPVSARVLVKLKDMCDYFIEDPLQAVAIGEQVKVRILAVDVPTCQIGGSMLAPAAAV